MPDIIIKKEAKARGLPYYYTGNPCKWGHVAERFVCTGGCVECNRERKATPDYKAYNKAACRAWYEANSERKKAYYEANAGRKRAASRAWYEVNADRARAASRAWREANPDKARVKNHNRRARKKSAEGSHTAQDIQNIYETQQGLCAYCKIDVGTNYHVDHIHPLSRGGSNGKENLQITCPTCNLRKNAKTHEEFLLDNRDNASILVPEHD